jgi:hypothetical protein
MSITTSSITVAITMSDITSTTIGGITASGTTGPRLHHRLEKRRRQGFHQAVRHKHRQRLLQEPV